MARILVTGAAGFIGSHTTDLLLAEGYEVVGVDNFRTGREANLRQALTHPHFSLRRLDVAEPGMLLGLTNETRPEAIIHLAALVSVPESIANPALNQRLNYEATQWVAEAALSAGTKRVVFASSAAVYGNSDALPLTETVKCRPLSPYGQAKLDSERLLLAFAQRHGFTVRCQRYFNVYGPRQDPSSPYSGVISRFAEAAIQGKQPMIHGDGEQTRDFVYVGDVARANLLAATQASLNNGTVNICTERAVSLNRLVGAIADTLGQPLEPVYGSPRIGDIRHSLGSSKRARDELGFEAVTSLSAGLRRLLAAD